MSAAASSAARRRDGAKKYIAKRYKLRLRTLPVAVVGLGLAGRPADRELDHAPREGNDPFSGA